MTDGPENGTAVILLHGFPQFHYGWKDQIPALAEAGFRVIVPDQRGYNLSDKPKGISKYYVDILAKDIVYAKNFYLSTPQEAYTIGLNYRSRKYWYVNVNFNYFDQMYLQISPVRRTAPAVNGLDPNSAQWHSIVDQTRLNAQHTLDAFAGYSWLMNNRFKGLHKRTFLLFNLGVNNILNNTNIVSGGFEQLRFDYAEKNVDKFPPKKFYAYGINFFASIGLRF